MSQGKNTGQSSNVNVGSKSFERVLGFRIFVDSLTNQNWTRIEIKSRWKSGNACYHSVQNRLSSGSLSKSMRFKMYVSVNCLLFCMGCACWGRNVGWGCWRIGCWAGYLGLRVPREQRSGEYIISSVMICTPEQILFGWWNRKEWDGRGM